MAKKEGVSFGEAVQLLQEGKCILYPTETFYALGALVTAANGLRQICRIKNRATSKPFPLIAGSMRQVLQYADVPLQAEKLAECFWPGPLSIVVRCKESLAREVCDENGFAAIRLTSHPVARSLCLETRSLLVATSANFASLPPAQTPLQLDPELKKKVAGCLLESPLPAGGLPSTLVRFEGDRLCILREGCIPERTIVNCLQGEK